MRTLLTSPIATLAALSLAAATACVALAAVAVLALPAAVGWYQGHVLRGIPAGAVVPFGVAIVVAVLTTRRQG